MPKYLLLKHYRGGPEPHRPVPPTGQWGPQGRGGAHEVVVPGEDLRPVGFLGACRVAFTDDSVYQDPPPCWARGRGRPSPRRRAGLRETDRLREVMRVGR